MSKLTILKEYLKESPDDPFLHFAIAKEHEKRENWDQALDKYAYLAEKHPDYVGTYYHYGLLRFRLNQIQPAREIVELGIQHATQQKDNHSANELRDLLQQIEFS